MNTRTSRKACGAEGKRRYKVTTAGREVYTAVKSGKLEAAISLEGQGRKESAAASLLVRGEVEVCVMWRGEKEERGSRSRSPVLWTNSVPAYCFLG